MSGLPFWIVDVFGYGPFSGNQLAVFLDAEERLDQGTMQDLAKETNFAETTFIRGRGAKGGAHVVRVFTPAMEVPFAGHPTLGTAHVLRDELGLVPDDAGAPIVLRMGVGDIPVVVRDGILWMTQVEPVFGSTVNPGVTARALGLDPGDIHPGLPVMRVSTGLPHIIVPLRDTDALARACPDPMHHRTLLDEGDARNVMAYCPGGHAGAPDPGVAFDGANVVSTRMFAHDLGIGEDSATGSGSGCLVAYLLVHGVYGSDLIRVRSEQGFEMGRPSMLLLEAEGHESGIRVRVGGRAVTMAHGEFRV